MSERKNLPFSRRAGLEHGFIIRTTFDVRVGPVLHSRRNANEYFTVWEVLGTGCPLPDSRLPTALLKYANRDSVQYVTVRINNNHYLLLDTKEHYAEVRKADKFPKDKKYTLVNKYVLVHDDSSDSEAEQIIDGPIALVVSPTKIPVMSDETKSAALEAIKSSPIIKGKIEQKSQKASPKPKDAPKKKKRQDTPPHLEVVPASSVSQSKPVHTPEFDEILEEDEDTIIPAVGDGEFLEL